MGGKPPPAAALLASGLTPPWTPFSIRGGIVSQSESRQKRMTVSFRVSLEQHGLIDAKAAASGRSAGQFSRDLALHDTGQSFPRVRRGPPRDASELRSLVGHLGKIGSNLNQIAACLNAGASNDRALLTDCLSDLNSMRSALAIALGVRGV